MVFWLLVLLHANSASASAAYCLVLLFLEDSNPTRMGIAPASAMVFWFSVLHAKIPSALAACCLVSVSSENSNPIRGLIAPASAIVFLFAWHRP